MNNDSQPFANRAATAAPNYPNPLWVLGAVLLGFALPICACAIFFFGSLSSLGNLGEGFATSNTATGPAIAIVRVEGTITHTDDEDYIAGAGSGRVIADLRAAEADPDVQAIILRVDSPGGTVTGSAQIREVIVNEVTKPVVVSMAGTAASGGYYVSAPADYIFARADTLTGSLGVVLTLINAKELIDTYGIDVVTITSGENKSIGSPWETLTEEQRLIFEAYIDESYEEFVRIIADGRGLSEDTVRQLADGRIYSGKQAVAIGLVDELGDLPQAIDKAADLGGIVGEPRLIEYEHIPDFTSLLLGMNSRLQTTPNEELLNIVYDLLAPRVEYRYMGR